MPRSVFRDRPLRPSDEPPARVSSEAHNALQRLRHTVEAYAVSNRNEQEDSSIHFRKTQFIRALDKVRQLIAKLERQDTNI